MKGPAIIFFCMPSMWNTTKGYKLLLSYLMILQSLIAAIDVST